VTDAGVAVKQHLGLFPNIRITANKAKDSGSSSSSATATASAMHSGSVNVAKAVSFMPHISVTSGAPVAVSHGAHNMHFKIGGRKLAQACDPQARVSGIIVYGVKGGVSLQVITCAAEQYSPQTLSQFIISTVHCCLLLHSINSCIPPSLSRTLRRHLER
jgi:hypothetical protein